MIDGRNGTSQRQNMNSITSPCNYPHLDIPVQLSSTSLGYQGTKIFYSLCVNTLYYFAGPVRAMYNIYVLVKLSKADSTSRGGEKHVKRKLYVHIQCGREQSTLSTSEVTKLLPTLVYTYTYYS